MFLSTKKFKKEIQELPKILEQADLLTPTEMEGIKQKVLLSVAHSPSVEKSQNILVEKSHKFMRYFGAVLVGLSLVGGTAFASNSSNPGDILYPVKRASEKLQISLAVSEQTKAELQGKFAQERLNELKKLAKQTPKHIESSAHDNTEFNFSTTTTGNLNLHIESGTGTQPTVTIEAGDGNNNDNNHNNNDKKNTNRINIEIRATHEAEREINSAVDALTKVQAKLEAKGQAQAAAAIAQNIANLKINAGFGVASTSIPTIKPLDPLKPIKPLDLKLKPFRNQATSTNSSSTTNIKINTSKNSGTFHIDINQNSNTGNQHFTGDSLNNSIIVTASSTSSSSIHINQNINSSNQTNFQQTFEQHSSSSGEGN